MVGSECHQIVSDTITAHREHAMRAGDFADMLRDKAAKSRPDLQPQIVDRFKAGAWTIATAICCADNGEPRSPEDIMRYDGGEGEHSGQLAYDVPLGDTIYRLTGEIDLLVNISDREVDLSDYKSGYRWWTGTDVRESFQLGAFYPNLVFRNYPEVERINVRVIMPAYADITAAVTITHKDRYAIDQRLSSALATYDKHRRAKRAEDVPCNPLPSRCDLCRYAIKCPMCARSTMGLSESPERLIQELSILSAAVKARETRLDGIVRQTGQDIEFGKLRYGTGKPKAKRAATCDLYEVGK
jgi:hypothetical protein